MQPFLRIRPERRPEVGLSLGILADRSEPWQSQARKLQVRRWKRLERLRVVRSHKAVQQTL